jgi:hypothetical protein
MPAEESLECDGDWTRKEAGGAIGEGRCNRLAHDVCDDHPGTEPMGDVDLLASQVHSSMHYGSLNLSVAEVILNGGDWVTSAAVVLVSPELERSRR